MRGMSKAFRFGPVDAAVSPLDAQTIFNSAYPYGFNQGPVWSGRGLTTDMRGAASLAVGPLSASFAPVVFQAQKTRLLMMDNGLPVRIAFGIPYSWPSHMPQRFGDRPTLRPEP